MHSPTSCFMNNSTGSLMVNTAHKISCLCECIGQGNILAPPPTPLHLIHSVLHSPSLFTFPPFHLCPWFPVFTISPPSPPSVLFSWCLCSVFNNPIHQEAQINFPCLLLFFPFVICLETSHLFVRLFLATCQILLFSRFSVLINHQQDSWLPPRHAKNVFSGAVQKNSKWAGHIHLHYNALLAFLALWFTKKN